MARSCIHFKLLSERIDILSEKFLLDQEKDELEDPIYFTPDLDRLAAFRLLVHAEIEDFLEAKAKENITAIGASLKNPNWMRSFPELLALSAILGKQLPSKDLIDHIKLSEHVRDLLISANKAIAENNGIKTSSFLLLSICSGKTIDEIDAALSASLNSYGKDRGDIAHRSVTRSSSLQAPSAELRTARSLVAALSQYFDVHVK